MTITRRILASSLAGALALTLAACNSGEGGADTPLSEPVAAVAPPEGQAWTDVVTVTDRGGYLQGNPDAPIKLVEYGSLTCPGCAAFSVDGSESLQSEYVATGRVSFEFRSFIIHGPLDLALTRLIGCGRPEAAIPLSDQIWANLQDVQNRAYADQQGLQATLKLPEDQRFVAFGQKADLFDFFAARGLSEDQAKTCLADWPSLENLAELSRTYAQDDKVTGTPTFEINGKRLELSSTERSWPQVEAALQRAGAR
ncbi:thioredoxin domain-containing protein [Altererythrobacter sp.]|uniref:thioredoxin domain-containing protein n=1 Tax=Altererythrobacter sp. TaxID=1872480 RepID=UPI003D05FF39